MDFKYVDIFSLNQKQTIQIPDQLLDKCFDEFKSYIQKAVGYSSRIYLYQKPINSFQKIAFICPSVPIKAILQHFPHLCLTYNNTQYRQQPEYYEKHPFTTKPSEQSIEIVLQICQNSNFIHENYRITLSSKLNFLMGICNRYGARSFLEYYNTRISFDKFGPNDTVANTVAKFKDHMGRITISVSSVDQGNQVFNFFQYKPSAIKINEKHFQILKIKGVEEEFAIDRRCSLFIISEMMRLSLNRQILIFDEQKNQFVEINDKVDQKNRSQVLFSIRQNENYYSIDLSNSVMIGSFENNIYFVQQSSILHRICLTGTKCKQTLKCYLPSPPTHQLDEDLFFIKDGFIIGYSITITYIKLKYFDFDGNFLFMKLQKWNQQLYEIQFNVVDLFCVRLKKQPYKTRKSIRIFHICDPEDYLQIDGFSQFYPSKFGNNSFSDGSMVFAVAQMYRNALSLYSLKEKSKIVQIVPQKYTISTVLFSHFPISLFCICYEQNFLSLHNFKGETIHNILAEPSMQNFLLINNRLFCTYSTQIRQFEESDIPKWGNAKNIGEAQIIMNDKQQVAMKDASLQNPRITGIYHLKN